MTCKWRRASSPMKLIARMHQCLEARLARGGNQSISSSTDAGRWTRTNLHSVAIDTARKWKSKERWWNRGIEKKRTC